MPSVTLSNLQVDEDPQYYVGGNPNNIQLSADIIINTNDINEQPFFYEVRNSENQIIAMQIHPQDHKIKPNTKENFKIGINQPSKDAYFPNGNYILNAWSVSTWTGRRFDWKQPLANLGHTGIKEWNRSSNIASISEKVSRIGTGFQRGQAYQAPITEPAAVTITEPLLPEISFLPEVYAEPAPITSVLPAPTLSPKIKKIIDDWSVKKIIVPAWFANNNMNWVLEGKITEQEFLDAYTHLVNTGAITFPKEPEPVVDQVTTNMIRQELLNFTIVNNRIQGSIKFTATDAFNPYYYNKPITTYLQLKSTDLPNWTQISTTNPKSNRLTFTETQRDETIIFDEDAQNLTFVNAESLIEPAMSEVLRFPIEAGKESTEATKSGLMGAGVLGIIGILMLGGFIADHVRKRK